MSKQNIQTEIDASYLYQKLAENEENPAIAQVFQQMSQIERGHALAFLKTQQLPESALPTPSGRAKVLNRIGKIFGYDYVLGVLLDTEKSISNATLMAKKKSNSSVTGTETNHVKILRNLLNSDSKIGGKAITKFESRHHSVGGNALRAAVLGGNDGLVSNFSLVMGVAGASEGKGGVLVAGLAGLLAGALSMALGEWISVKSSQELYENQMQLELDELQNNPAGEMQELSLIYQAKGIDKDQADRMATEAMQDESRAHQILIEEELGINPEELKGSAFEAAAYSFVLFAIGAVIPVFPFFFFSGLKAVLYSALLSALGLFGIGSAITLFTGKSIWASGLRQVFFGLIAAAITYGIGKIIGVSIAG